jgi:hypothetical protein
VLPRAGLGDHPGLAHPLGQQRLTQHVAHLVGAGVVEVLPLEQDLGAHRVGQPGGPVEQRRHPGVVDQQVPELRPEPAVGLGRPVGGVQLVERPDQRLRHEPAAVPPEVPGQVGQHRRGHRTGLGVAGWLPAFTSSATASRGDFWVTRPSPTSTASAPADA